MATPDYIVEAAKDGNSTLYILREGKKIPLHSTVSPAGEAGLLKNFFDPGRYDKLVVLGIGLGYHLSPLSGNLDRYSAVILIDILKGIEKNITSNPETGFLTRNRKVTFVTGLDAESAAEKAVSLLSIDSASGISIIEHPSSNRLFQEYYGKIKKIVTRHINTAAGNLATKKQFGMRYIRNIVSNISTFDSAMMVSDLKNIFKGMPVLVVSSGPSIGNHIESIRKYQRKLIIIAVDSAMPILQSHEIQPDVVVSIDPQPYTMEHLMGINMNESIFVYSLSSCNAGLGKARRFLSLNTHPFSQLVDHITGGAIGSIDSGTGTVAGDSLALALHTGASMVGLLGFDFSFPWFTIYSRGTAYQNRYSLFYQTRITPVESQNASYIMKSSGGHRTEGAFTRKSFIGYRDRLSELVKRNGIRNVFSINTAGLPIENVPVITFDRFIREHCGRILEKSPDLTGLTRVRDIFNPSDFTGALYDKNLLNTIIGEAFGSVDETIKNKIIALIAHSLK